MQWLLRRVLLGEAGQWDKVLMETGEPEAASGSWGASPPVSRWGWVQRRAPCSRTVIGVAGLHFAVPSAFCSFWNLDGAKDAAL